MASIMAAERISNYDKWWLTVIDDFSNVNSGKATCEVTSLMTSELIPN